MFKVNEYFGGKVSSIAFGSASCPATVGVMAPGEYEFGTAKKERMTVVDDKLTAKLPGDTAWKDYGPGDTFTLAPDKKFQMKVGRDTAYLCLYTD
ncbi:MAG: hypothetical protein COT18_09035 [Elusimicrobia bacterium CG08_land_8_20_14_0_20_59_10]|nr:MAG: hypothetical protein COT18_09035 [Elusimicrobia bacterium CG08_land_8_20_14_0_20_59_10]